jgi:polyphosphate glucokinase
VIPCDLTLRGVLQYKAVMEVLVIDVGGSGVKLTTSNVEEKRRFKSQDDLSPRSLVEQVQGATADWSYDAIALGYPGLVLNNTPAAEPGNLGEGWIGFDFQRAFDRPTRVVNDAVMQALGAYDGGRMLFLGLGTGVGSALVTEHVLVPLELGCLPHVTGATIAQQLGRSGLERHGHAAWQRAVFDLVAMLREAFLADYVVLGGGNARKVDPLPPRSRRGGNHDAFTGGFRLWEETVLPHDGAAAPVWRIVR